MNTTNIEILNKLIDKKHTLKCGYDQNGVDQTKLNQTIEKLNPIHNDPMAN